jgi:hypothetical protein
MNVKKIIVDELPSTCRMCKFQSVRPVKNGLRMYCSLKDKMVHNLRVRPDWCPLVIDECCEWKYLGVHMWQTCEQHARHMYPDKRYVYCPSCGKRIKYVEE